MIFLFIPLLSLPGDDQPCLPGVHWSAGRGCRPEGLLQPECRLRVECRDVG